MQETVSLQIIYFYLILEKASEKDFSYLNTFFQQNTFFDIITFDNLNNILYGVYDINEFKNLTEQNQNNLLLILDNIKKLKKVLELYINNKIKNKLSAKEIIKNLGDFINLVEDYENNEITDFLVIMAKHIQKRIKKYGLTAANLALYKFFDEYAELFNGAEEIIYNSNFINENFRKYFNLLGENPDNMIFINKKDNIKIMQDLFPQKCLYKILDITGCKYKTPEKKYFLTEIDKKLVSDRETSLIQHEVGHLLNLCIYNFQSEIINFLYVQNSTVNIQILNNWLNEIIADIIGNNLSGQSILKGMDNVLECGETEKYPPTVFRKAILANSGFDFSYFKNDELKKIAELIYKNLAGINKILSIVN